MKYKITKRYKKKKDSLLPVPYKSKGLQKVTPEKIFEENGGALVRNYISDDFGRFDEKNEKKKRRKRPKRPPREWISPYKVFGALTGALCVAFISAFTVIFSLFFGRVGRYTTVNIPKFVTDSAETAIAKYPDVFDYEIVYASNPERQDGVVLSQSPVSGVTRRFYKGEKIKVTLTVNKDTPTFTLPSVVGKNGRDTELLLKNEGISVDYREEYSHSVPYGEIIAASLPEGAQMRRGDEIVLRVSRGKETEFFTVPNLIGLGELEAIAKLNALRFEVDGVKYERSKQPIGTVIMQSIASGTTLPEGSRISLTVSGGLYYEN